MRLINALIKTSNLISYRSFLKGSDDVLKIQEFYLLDIIKDNCDTVYGRRFKFSEINGISEYQKQVPISDYDDHESYIKMHMEGTEKGLVEEPIELFELSSGSTAASKYIPYTKGLQSDYMAGVKPWLYNLYHHYPELMQGKAYWSVSPIASERTYTTSGIPIGFQDDTGYFDFIQKHLFNKLFVIPSEIKLISDMEDFRYVTLLFLLKEKKLSLISVWNPTFLINLLEVFFTYQAQLIEDIERGQITLPNHSDLPLSLRKRVKPSKKRASELRQLSTKTGRCIFHEVWLNLRLISCWDQGNSKPYKKRLEGYFSDVAIQGKGLLATEGIVSIPLEGIGCPVSYRSHFFEFQDRDNNEIKLLHELEKGKLYDVIMTTRGGLYRYRLNDIVKVTRHYHQVPCIEFIGKASNVSDFFGEKINEMHVRDIFSRLQLLDAFIFLAPTQQGDNFCYTLFTVVERDDLSSIVEEELSKNFHYKYARDLNQLDHVRVFKMTGDYEKAYYDFLATRKNMKLGDIKFQSLIKVTGINEAVEGDYILER